MSMVSLGHILYQNKGKNDETQPESVKRLAALLGPSPEVMYEIKRARRERHQKRARYRVYKFKVLLRLS